MGHVSLWFICCWKLDIWKKNTHIFADWLHESVHHEDLSSFQGFWSIHLSSPVCVLSPPIHLIYTDTFKCLNFSKGLSSTFSQGLRCSIYSSVCDLLLSGNYGSPIAPHFSHAATPSTAFSGFQPVIQTMLPFLSKLQVKWNRNQSLRQPLDK